jgi:hypothetical protein
MVKPKVLQRMFPGRGSQAATQATDTTTDGDNDVFVEPEIEELAPEPEPKHPPVLQAGQGALASPPSTPSPPSSLMSHPVTPARGGELLPVTHASPGGGGNGGEPFNTHLRKMTTSLLEIVDQMSQAASSKGRCFTS